MNPLATLVCALCIQIIPQVDLCLSPSGASGSLHGIICLKFTDVSGCSFRSHHKSSRQACGLDERIGRVWEKLVFRSGGHTGQMAGGWAFLMGGNSEVREGEIRWSVEDWYTFRATDVNFLRVDHRNFFFAPCNMHRGETLKSCICQFSYLYNLRND